MKSKLTISIASILSVLVLVGVGFAAWVIINPNVHKEAESTITAETVTDKSYTLEATFAADEKIVFGAPETTIAGAWLTNPTKEDLTAELTLTLTYNDWNVVPDNFNITMATTGENSVFNELREGVKTESKAKGFKIIANPTISDGDKLNEVIVMNGAASTIAKTSFKQAKSGNTATLIITITFQWGTNGNPYTYYNGKDYAKFREEANAVLTELYRLNTETYKVTISGDTKVA
mgnify:CR=1 FL=1